MRVLFATAPFRSHLFVQAPLAWALRTAGHDVRVAAQPDMADDIMRCGLTAVPVGRGVDLNTQMSAAEPQENPADPRNPGPGLPVQTDYARDDPLAELGAHVGGCRALFNPEAVIEELVEFARDWEPDLVVWDTFAFAGVVAARACGAAHARMLFGADGLGQLRAACRPIWDGQPPQARTDPLREWLEPVLARYGCAFDEETALGQWTIFPMPTWVWRPPGIHYLPMRHMAFNGPSSVPKWLHRPPARPRVCVTLGLSHRERNFGVVASAADLFAAVDGLDVEVIAALDATQLRSVTHVPDNVRVHDFVPLNVLLPTCSAIVHSGGAGTFASALEHGVPQLIVPNIYWAEKWWGPVLMANGLEDQGAGVYVADADHLTADTLRDRLVRVLEDPSFAGNAERLRRETLGMPTPNDVVPILERLTAAQHGRSK
ncbi:activator-dependent family glycosyltransferase [Microbispora amethystogenes]|uniref:activator-dependent family glycosyltransferase n=1 Tax=Microbispora amethystogenes TaxID=1427754 RepID=UPI0033D96C17